MGASRAKRAEVAERRAKAISMVLAGLDYETIADRLGYASRGAAHTDIDRALRANLSDLKTEAITLREVQVRRYQRLLASVWPMALKGDLKAVEAAARLVDRIVRIYGLNEPERMNLDLTGQITADDLMALIQNAPKGHDADG